MRRRTLAVVAVCVLAASAGCTALFGDDISKEQLDAEPPAPYDWNTSRDVTITVHEDGNYQAVYNLSAVDTATLKLFERGLGNDRPLSVRSVRYRYPNGTVINGSAPQIKTGLEGSRRVIEAPNASGALAYTSSSGGKEFSSPAFVSGSYEVILPPGQRVGSFLFGDVDPPGYQTRIDDGNRVHVTWNSVDSDVYVQYYLIRDVLIFRGLVLVMFVVGVAGSLYYYRQIRKLERRREELGLDVDTDDDFGGGPPPGMR